MEIKVLLFAHLQEEAGQAELIVDLDGSSVQDLLQQLGAVFEFSGLSQAMVAVNEEFADDATILNSGDVVALLPPVSGG
ncbi:molybdopterin converting factor subunit 1 [Falsibacillus albus]|uniref:Molybdopterin synthase sulfur carrier subunit n=1 Tax=Falsibacillus albus TaxID=2478915 RepID=A0A3L7JRI5_9BACI|nr:molybdopterin converting factor subunit 1 [Falsibacillus albus]RLQ93448.1 molybdopterin converting factor subunit 1 [Falsibacillus albus]